MAQQSVVKKSAAAAAADTDTVIYTPAAGIRFKLLAFQVGLQGAALAAGTPIELRYGALIVGYTGWDLAAAPIGMTTKQQIMAHEFIGDGATTVVARNLTTLPASAIAVYVLTYDSNFAA